MQKKEIFPAGQLQNPQKAFLSCVFVLASWCPCVFWKIFHKSPSIFGPFYRSFSSGLKSKPKPKWLPSAVTIRFRVLETHPTLNSLCTRSRAQHMWLSHADHPRGFIGSNLTPQAKGGLWDPGAGSINPPPKNHFLSRHSSSFVVTQIFLIFFSPQISSDMPSRAKGGIVPNTHGSSLSITWCN